MLKKKKELGLTFERISEICRIPASTIQNYLYGVTDNPRYDVIAALEKLFDTKPAGFVFRDNIPALAYTEKLQGDYTEEDYTDISNDHRCELIDGCIYDLAAPTPEHQVIAFNIAIQLENHVSKHHGSCSVFLSPVDVRLDEKSTVQPDVFVVCDPDKIKMKDKIYGAPDLVIEVLSPSTAEKDKLIKTPKYLTSGVHEYWVIDPERKMVYVYYFDGKDVMPSIFPFSYPVPVNIWDGACSVDLSRFA